MVAMGEIGEFSSNMITFHGILQQKRYKEPGTIEEWAGNGVARDSLSLATQL